MYRPTLSLPFSRPSSFVLQHPGPLSPTTHTLLPSLSLQLPSHSLAGLLTLATFCPFLDLQPLPAYSPPAAPPHNTQHTHTKVLKHYHLTRSLASVLVRPSFSNSDSFLAIYQIPLLFLSSDTSFSLLLLFTSFRRQNSLLIVTISCS